MRHIEDKVYHLARYTPNQVADIDDVHNHGTELNEVSLKWKNPGKSGRALTKNVIPRNSKRNSRWRKTDMASTNPEIGS